jgi:(E)-4-hydroxy-3-methylbut-2-enyl-diphosphate synthase
MSYCASRSHTLRRRTLEVKVGSVGVGAHHPIRIQSMTTSDTQDVAATVRQSIALAEVGCEIVRVTAPNVAAARCLKDIRAQFSAAGFSQVPLVADIHFLPSAAMEAVEHVEKIRVNPGNYADKKKFAVREYSDSAYHEELARLHEAFSPLVKRCRELGRAMRIGTNHGSLSDRIMNRYGDTPLGMVESALEFLRIAEANDYRQIVLSMKASNPKVMIQAYRLLVQRMAEEDMHYPLHLGVTEAGDGEDGRIKSAIGIGSLLLDGLGDTIRVSLTEDSVYEIPVAQAIAAKAMSRWTTTGTTPPPPLDDGIDPFHYTRRATTPATLAPDLVAGAENPPRVIVRCRTAEDHARLDASKLDDTPAEGRLTAIAEAQELASLPTLKHGFHVLELSPQVSPADFTATTLPAGTLLLRRLSATDTDLVAWATLTRARQWTLALAVTPAALAPHATTLNTLGTASLIFTPAEAPATANHAIGGYRQLIATLRAHGLAAPIWIRNTAASAVLGEQHFPVKTARGVDPHGSAAL